MSKIKSGNTKPKIIVRSNLHNMVIDPGFTEKTSLEILTSFFPNIEYALMSMAVFGICMIGVNMETELSQNQISNFGIKSFVEIKKEIL